MGDLLSKVLPLALGAAVSPTVLALTLVILSGRRPIARGSAFVAGVLTVFAGLTALGLIGSHQSHKSPAQTEITQVVDLIAGCLLLLLALGTILRSYLTDPATPPEDPTPDPDARPGVFSAFVLGIAVMVVNFSTILLYLPAMREISAARVASAEKVVAVAIALLIASSPAWLPFVFRVAAPGFATRIFGSLHGFIARHSRQIGVAIEVIFGVYLLIKGLR